MGEQRLSRLRLTGLGANLALFVLVPSVLNGLIFGLGWSKAAGVEPGLPPGWVVGTIWLVLFALMGAARWRLLLAGQGRAEWVSAVAVLCLLYPLYTAGLSNMRVGEIGNLLTLAVALVVAASSWRRDLRAGVLLLPLCAWLLYAAGVTGMALARA
jgi:tryptophan-rich sensory protein